MSESALTERTVRKSRIDSILAEAWKVTNQVVIVTGINSEGEGWGDEAGGSYLREELVWH